VSAGFRTICGIKTDGSAWCWGSNEYGRLGDGTTKYESSKPVRVVSDSGWRDVESAWRHTCGIKVDGTQWCWGYGSGSVPVQRGAGTSWADLEGGYHYTCGLTADQGLGCNPVVPPADPSTDPAPVPPAGTWVDLAALSDTACALKAEGTIWCGPQASDNQLGTDTDWAQISGSVRLCAVKSTGTLWCAVTSGTPSTMEQKSPDTDWVSTTVADQNGCATKSNGSGWCWSVATDGSGALTKLHFVP
jgi:alpha-tubulin suppressor-like RCC1 family protein